jgi:hypothetical protein
MSMINYVTEKSIKSISYETQPNASRLASAPAELEIPLTVPTAVLRLKRAGRCCFAEETNARDCLTECPATVTLQGPAEIWLD